MSPAPDGLQQLPDCSAAARLPTGMLLTYSLPSAGIGFMALLISIYLMKFSTDVLLIAPATMGLWLGVARLASRSPSNEPAR